MSLLEVDRVSKRFGGLVALDAVSLSVEQGEIVGVMGANGAGKTTLFSLIAGHQKPDGGTVRLRDRVISGLRPDQICRLGLTRTFQIVRPFEDLTVLEGVTVGALYGSRRDAGRKAAEAAARDAITLAGLADRLHQPGGTLTLSGQKRLEVARALATGAAVLMLDEVMAGLTPTEVEEMLAVIARIRSERGITVLIIEHVMKALMRLSDRVLVLHHGKPIALGTPATVAADPHVLEVYYGGAA